MPFSSAILRARGLALSRPSVLLSETVEAGTEAATGSAAGVAAATGVDSAGSVVAGDVVVVAPESKDWKSSPSLPTTAIGPSTVTASPSCTTRCKTVPLEYTSISIVALSVSTSAMISPLLTVSPTFTFHFTITPSVIVSLILGMVIKSAILFKRLRCEIKQKMCYCKRKMFKLVR